jgi:spermidine/putrescine transport system ATP-binding protein
MPNNDSDNTKTIVNLKAIQKWFGDNHVLKNISFDIFEGEFLSFLGPSGCGKTTCLRLLAGFEKPTSGEIWIDKQNMENCPPNKRNLSMVFQDYSLFPHMNVYENVAFGLKERRIKKDIIRVKVKDALSLVQLSGFDKRKPHELSGGQKQRVAIARSIVLNPKLLLLDEPLGALDLKLRKQMQTELKSLQEMLKITFVYVTHDQDEALTMSTRIIVLNEGEIQQAGTPLEIYRNPNSRFVADFIGETTFFDGYVVKVEGKKATANLNGIEATIKADGLSAGQNIILSVRPETIKLREESERLENCYQGVLSKYFYKGSNVEYYIRLENDIEIAVKDSPKNELLKVDSPVAVGWEIDDAVIIKK